jgi:hypothetical protein
MQHHNYTLQDIESWVPFERDVYVGMLLAYLKEEKERLEAEQRKR